MGSPPPQMFFGGTVPPVPLSLRPWIADILIHSFNFVVSKNFDSADTRWKFLADPFAVPVV